MYTNIYIRNTYMYVHIDARMYICARVCCTIHIRVRMYKEIGVQKNMYLCVKCNTYYIFPTHFVKQKHLSLPTYVSELAHCRFIRRQGGFELKLILECRFLLIPVKGVSVWVNDHPFIWEGFSDKVGPCLGLLSHSSPSQMAYVNLK